MGGKETEAWKGDKKGRERDGGGVEGRDVISIVTMMLVHGVQDYVCASTPDEATTSLQNSSPDTVPTSYWTKQSTCQHRPLLGQPCLMRCSPTMDMHTYTYIYTSHYTETSNHI